MSPDAFQWCGAGDLNGDAHPDFVCEGRVLLGTGKGTFVRGGPGPGDGWPAECAGPGFLFADVNRDGKLDVLTSDYGMWLGDGAGGLTPSTVAPLVADSVQSPISITTGSWISSVLRG